MQSDEGAAIDGRRTETKQRIREIALEVFSEQGWEGATLQEIATRIGITRPALYYHYNSKDAILASIHDDLASSIDGIVESARPRPRDATSRVALLRDVSTLIFGEWGAFMRFAQREESAMRNLKGTDEFVRRMNALTTLLQPDDSIKSRIRARLALDALFMAAARDQHLGGTPQQRQAAALEVAAEVVNSTTLNHPPSQAGTQQHA